MKRGHLKRKGKNSRKGLVDCYVLSMVFMYLLPVAFLS